MVHHNILTIVLVSFSLFICCESDFAYVFRHVGLGGLGCEYKDWDDIGNTTSFILDEPPSMPMTLYICTVYA